MASSPGSAAAREGGPLLAVFTGGCYGSYGMKTTLELDDDLVRRAKQEAARAGIPLRRLVEDALRARLLPRAREQAKFRLDVPIVSGTAPPAVDVADRDALYDLLERG